MKKRTTFNTAGFLDRAAAPQKKRTNAKKEIYDSQSNPS